MTDNTELGRYRRRLHRNLKKLAPIYAKASVGDFSQDVDIPHDDTELAVFFVGTQIILDAIREKVAENNATLDRLNDANYELEHEKAAYNAILNSIAEGMVVVDKDAHITHVNQAAADMLGQKIKDMIGCNYYDLVITKDRNGEVVPIANRPLQQALRLGRKQIKTLADGLHYVHSSGLLIPVSITASPVVLGRQTIGAVSTFRDISEEKILDRTKSEIISIASHQLRTPLTAIKWVSEQLLKPMPGMDRAVKRKYLRQVHSSNERMIALVNDLLNVSRVELGTLSLDTKSFDLTDMIDDVLKDLRSQIKGKRLKVRKSIKLSVKTVTTDPRHMQVILQNLIGNAVKYSPEKQTITITGTKQDNQIRLAIKDTGYGIPKAQQAKIFTKLFRADNARVVASEGSGLGLYVCRAMAEQLGGKVWFESVENKGSTFFVTIPWTDEIEATKEIKPSA